MIHALNRKRRGCLHPPFLLIAVFVRPTVFDAFQRLSIVSKLLFWRGRMRPYGDVADEVAGDCDSEATPDSSSLCNSNDGEPPSKQICRDDEQDPFGLDDFFVRVYGRSVIIRDQKCVPQRLSHSMNQHVRRSRYG
ncbi:hypothetical protein GCK32_015726 [Trichostrongylus colubriformis]|uniref:Uncharacterized protein n=1 Tax=Trichostrongylus colubriformis TaxID=6319 RepID=A0AAN8IDY0_TRICO